MDVVIGFKSTEISATLTMLRRKVVSSGPTLEQASTFADASRQAKNASVPHIGAMPFNRFPSRTATAGSDIGTASADDISPEVIASRREIVRDLRYAGFGGP